jgi:peptidoglycan/xylan/chitin deacetylase (PgdA/CDA1 family)
MIRHIFAMHVPAWGRSLGLPLTLGQLAATGFAPAATGPSGAPSVAITFDDGPHPDGTPRMIDALAQFDAKATFFMIGEQVVKRPELARQVIAAGHAIGLHGYRHRPHPLRPAGELADDFERGLAAIEDAAGIQPLLHRPPYGIYSPASLRITREHGLQPLLWSQWGKDWRKVTTPEHITRRVCAAVKTGDVILLHDADYYSSRCSHRRTAAAVPEIMKMLKSAGFGTVTYA